MRYKLLLYLLMGFFVIIIAGIPAYSQPDASRATRESDRFGAEKEKQVERELRRVPPPPPKPKVTEEGPKEGEQQFFIKKINLVGCESFPPEDFIPFIEKFENRDVTLTELDNLSKEISTEYLRRGVIAAVFLPPQEVQNQTITLQVVEARMGELQVDKLRFFNKKRLKSYWTIKPGEILRYDKMYKNLQIMNKNPDREVRSSLHAGTLPGTTDVVLTTKTRFPIHGQYTFDREGITTTGKERSGFGIRNNNLLGYDDTLLSGISFGKNFNGIYAYHNLPISPSGATLLYGHSYSKSTPKKDFDVFSLKSESETTTFAVHQDIYKRESYIGEVHAGFDAKDKVTFFSSGTGTLNRDRLRILTLGGTYIMRGLGSVTYISPELSQGVNAFGTSKKNNPLASRLGATPTYTKFFLDIQNRTSLPFHLQQALKFKMQLPSEKLFSQEQYGLGGIDTVRGYPPSDYLADKMVLVNAELLSPVFFIPKDWKLPYAEKSFKDQLTAITFFDYAYAETRGNPKPFRLSSVGVGLRMSFYNQILLRLEWGFPLKLLGMDSLSEGMAPARFHISLNVEDNLPTEIERIIKEMREERMEREAWDLVDEELSRPDSPIRKKMAAYLYLAEDFYREGRLKESKEMYAIVANMSKSLYKEAQAYVRGCKAHEEELDKKSQDALAAYNDGRLDEAKRLWDEVSEESRPRPLVFKF